MAATIIDIRTYTPTPADELLLDTNVWYWFTYSRVLVHAAGRHDLSEHLQRAERAVRRSKTR